MTRIKNRKVIPIHGVGVPTEEASLAVGEIAVSTKAGEETLFTKNSEGNVAEIDLSHYSILTQEQYDALTNKPENHIYYIKP